MNVEQIVLDNQKLVYKVASYFKYQDKEDLIQEGNIGFLKAIGRYNSEKGAKVTTYAYSDISGSMKQYTQQDKGVKISRDISKLNLLIEKATIMLTQKLMRYPSVRELANYLEEPEYKIAEALGSINPLQSIDEPSCNNDGKELTLHEIIADKSDLDIDTLLDLKNALQTLAPFERQLIEMRYLKEYTQSEIAKILNITQVQVSRTEQKILSLLRNRLIN